MKMNWNFNRDATTACVPPIQPLRLTYREPLKDTRKTVFHPDETRGQSSARTSKINLEDFVERDNVVIQPNFDDCTMELRLNEFADCTTQESGRNYRRALENIKRALPNLRTVRFNGQHYFYPENASTEKLRQELSLVHRALDSVTGEMRRLNLRTAYDEPLRYDLYLVFDKKHVPSFAFERYASEIFGRSARIDSPSISDLRPQTIRCSLNGTECSINFHVFTHLHMLHDLQGFLVHDRMGGAEALSRMLALTLEMKLANDHY